MYPFLKRTIDLFVALVTIIILSPFLIIICIALLLTGEHEVFYFQERIGFKNKTFNICKFATMLKNSPNLGTGSITLRDDPRVTSVGKFLRQSKINELPQVLNILKGDMTLVGPRPHMEFDFNHYPEHIKKTVFNVKPGITGIGSIVFRDQEMIFTKAKMDPHKYYKKYMAPYKGELEIWYQNNMSFFTDIKIIFLTAWVILFPSPNLVYNVFPTLPKEKKFPTYEELSEEERIELS